MNLEKHERYEKVKDLISNGMKVQEACKKVGYSSPSFYARRKKEAGMTVEKPKKRRSYKPKLTHIEIPNIPQGKILLVLGSSEELMNLARGYLQ